MPLVSRTRATLLSAEFGFFGVCVNTRTQTPRFCGLFCSAGLLVLLTIFLRPARTSWLIVGIRTQLRIADCGVRIDCGFLNPHSALRNPQGVASGLKADEAWRPKTLVNRDGLFVPGGRTRQCID